ncbi:protein of unknown function [Candidatus Filomicrobium marinum]|uniref:Uncharacterized protein n=1 Tax=Candidatus Filomicrobium marinum TaxID=1608628 RepID=A0A0D6JH26_9HYPH|nr:protein of unknown function [Candidatus Filomicrobium marinum]CPR20043.1 protein of unknown function [Candidatus Filomicrobium marinum]
MLAIATTAITAISVEILSGMGGGSPYVFAHRYTVGRKCQLPQLSHDANVSQLEKRVTSLSREQTLGNNGNGVSHRSAAIEASQNPRLKERFGRC